MGNPVISDDELQQLKDKLTEFLEFVRGTNINSIFFCSAITGVESMRRARNE